MIIPDRCPLCNDVVTSVSLENNVQPVYVDKAGYDWVNGVPMGRSGKDEVLYIAGRREKRHAPCGCVVEWS